MKINILKLEENFEKFKIFVKNSSGQDFTSFDNKYVDEQENYKKLIYNNSLDILKVDSWKPDDIGTGKIIGLLEETIKQEKNNLLIHDDRRGEEARQDKLLIKAKKDKKLLIKLEKILFDLYKSNVSDEESFNNILSLSGKIYPFLAFLFFIKSNRKYLPIAPNTFDTIFKELKIDFITSKRCSWNNYTNFIEIIREVRCFLFSKEEIIDEVDLLDAHSFLWILAKQMKEYGKEIEEKIKGTVFSLTEVSVPKEKREINSSKIKATVIKDGEDFDKENLRKRIKGKESEEIVFKYERDYLRQQGKKELADKVEKKSDEVSLGYDILSFDIDGNEKHIEVKTQSSNNMFWLTRNELETSRNDSSYYMYVVDKKTLKILDLKFKDIESNYTIVPEIFKVYF